MFIMNKMSLSSRMTQIPSFSKMNVIIFCFLNILFCFITQLRPYRIRNEFENEIYDDSEEALSSILSDLCSSD